MKQYYRYQMDFESKALKTSAACIGGALFALMFFYFGMTNLADCSFGEILFSLILPSVLYVVWIVLISGVKRNAPGLYGILGACLCLCVLLNVFSVGSGLRILLAVIWYVFAAAILIATAGGYLPGRTLASFVFLVPFGVRLVFFDLGRLSLSGWVREASILLTLAALVLLPAAMRAGKKR